MLTTLNKHTKISPPNVYKAFTNAVQQKLTFITRATPISQTLTPRTDKIFSKKLMPSMINHPSYSSKYRDLFRCRFAKAISTSFFRVIESMSTNDPSCVLRLLDRTERKQAKNRTVYSVPYCAKIINY